MESRVRWFVTNKVLATLTAKLEGVNPCDLHVSPKLSPSPSS